MRLTEQAKVLKEEIRRQERNQQRETAVSNMEYLKNIVFKVSAAVINSVRKGNLKPPGSVPFWAQFCGFMCVGVAVFDAEERGRAAAAHPRHRHHAEAESRREGAPAVRRAR